MFEYSLDSNYKEEENIELTQKEFGYGSSSKGIYRILPYRETSLIELFRGGTAMGVRGIIDPFDPENPYGPKSSKDISLHSKY